MKCPACGRELTAVQVGAVTVDACKGGCGGFWFDLFELDKVDEPDEKAGEVLLNIDVDPNVKVDPEKRLRCPKCPDVVMMRRLHSPSSRLFVDECGNCGGHWLDAGELRQLRSGAIPEGEYKAQFDALFNEKFGAQVAQLQASHAAGSVGFHPVFSLFRFLFPGLV